MNYIYLDFYYVINYFCLLLIIVFVYVNYINDKKFSIKKKIKK